MSYHSYADDTQLYLVIQPLDTWENISSRLQACLIDISEWMCLNMLKLNQDKTELMVFAPKHQTSQLSNSSLVFDSNTVNATKLVKNLGIYFDSELSMEKQSQAVSKACFFICGTLGVFEALSLMLPARL